MSPLPSDTFKSSRYAYHHGVVGLVLFSFTKEKQLGMGVFGDSKPYPMSGDGEGE